MRLGFPLLLAIHLAVGVALAALLFVSHPFAMSDVTLYYVWSGRVLDGDIPYRDFFFDYPPLAFPPMVIPWTAAGFRNMSYGTYIVFFGLLMALLWCATLAVTRVTAGAMDLGRRRLTPFLVPATLALPIMLIRFEPWPILLTGLALLATVRGSPGWSGAWLGLGIATKLYPAAIVPLFTVWWVLRRGARAGAVHVALAVGSATIPLMIAMALSGDGVFDMLAFHQDRGLQVESAAAGVIQLLHLGAPDALRVGHVTSFELRGSAVDNYLALQPLLAVTFVGATLGIGALRLRQSAESATSIPTLMAVSMAALIAFMVTNRALSPQHVLWLLPFAWLLAGRLRWLLMAILGMTLVVFPLLYEGLLAGDVGAVLALNIRNALLLLVGALALVPARDPTICGSRTEKHRAH